MSENLAGVTVVEPENMSIYEALALRELFSDALKMHQEIEVNLANVAEIDCAGLQLMIALKNDALKLSKKVIFTGHSTEVIDFLNLFNITSFFGDPVILGK